MSIVKLTPKGEEYRDTMPDPKYREDFLQYYVIEGANDGNEFNTLVHRVESDMMREDLETSRSIITDVIAVLLSTLLVNISSVGCYRLIVV